MRKKIEVEKGHKFGRLTVVKEIESKGTDRYFLLKCDCDSIVRVRLNSLRRGITTSCGCYREEVRLEAITKHNLSRDPLYKIWRGMKQRCCNKNNSSFERYGGRQITICLEWIDDPQRFVEWGKANGWKPGLEIDRKDNDKGYTPKNCRFVTPQVNLNNRRNTILVKIKGNQMPFSEAVEKYGVVSYNVAKTRYKRLNWSLTDALTTPVRNYK